MKSFTKYFVAFLLGFFVVACSKVPITGRKQLKLLPNSMLLQMGQANYATFLKENPAVNPPTKESAEVTAVGVRVSQAVDKFMNDNGMAKNLAGYKWEFNIVDSKDINAWCMPGGKVVVYTGIMPLAKNDAGLAVVMGHEIAHAVANHGNERMSQQLAIQLGGISLALAIQQKPQQTQDIFLASFGVASTLGSLAYSRQHELEADKLGLIFMAMAGYDPIRAVTFWQEMAKVSAGNKPAEFLSTHPSDERRIAQIQAFLPEAQKYYHSNLGNPATEVKETGNKTAVSQPAQAIPPKSPDAKKLGLKIK